MDRGPRADTYFGKRPMQIEGPFHQRPSRLSPDGEFENIDRKWRAQWLKDQKLSPRDAGGSVRMEQLLQNPDYQ